LKYLSLYCFYSPKDVERSLFNLKPERNCKHGDKVWFERHPIGKNMLNKRVKAMCKEAGLEGNFSNHTLRATAVTRMFKAGLAEKQIMKRSAHQSVEGVRTYQREDPDEKRVVSNVLSSSSVVPEGAATSTRECPVHVEEDVVDEDDALLVQALRGD